MGTHHRRKGAEVAPAQQQLFAALHLEQGRIAADVAVVQAVPGHRQRQRRRDDGRQTVVQAPVDVLIPRPHHHRVLLAAGIARAHEEQDLAELAGLLKRFVVTFGPQGRPGVMHDLRAHAVVQEGVGRQIFPEIGHPAAAAQFDQVLFNDLFVPVVGCRVGQVDNARVELAELDVVVLAVGVFGQIAALRRLFAEIFIAGDVRVDIGEELHAFLFPLRNPRIKLRIERAVPLPVPHHALAEGGHANAGPVLRPDAVDLHAALAHGVELLLAHLGAALNAQRHAVVHPVRQFRLTPQQAGQFFQQIDVGFCAFEAQRGVIFPERQLVEIRRAEIKVHVAAVIHVAVVLLGAHEGRLREEGPVVVAARVLFAVGLPGDVGLLIAAHALLAGPQRERLAAQIEIRELLAAAVNMIVWLRRQPQPDAVMAGGVIFQLQLQTAFRIHAHQQRRAYRIAAGKADRPARVLLRDGRVRQGNLFVELVFDAEVAAKHLDIRLACANPQARGIRGVG